MAAFNWIVFDALCPFCSSISLIKAQCHVASTFEGDALGRFCNKTYRLNEDMLWWKQGNSRWPEWIAGGQSVRESMHLIDECCYANCTACNAEMFVVITFEAIRPINIRQIGLEKNWPSDFKK